MEQFGINMPSMLVWVAGGEAIFEACSLAENQAEQDGGALYVVSGSVTLTQGTQLESNIAGLPWLPRSVYRLTLASVLAPSVSPSASG